MGTGALEIPAPSFIRFGTVLAGPERFTFNGNVNPVYRGQIMLSGGAIVSAFIKDLAPREFANELLAAALGLRLGLPIPMPIIARASSDVLSATLIPLAGTEDHVVFASHAVGAVPILQIIRDAGPAGASIIEMLSRWDGLGRLYGFDTWVANIDRHRGNLLLSGEGAVWMIDHGQCFTGPAWQASELVAAAPATNRLSQWLTPNLSGKKRSELQASSEGLASDAAGVDVTQMGDAPLLSDVLGADFNAIIAYLGDRLAHVSEFSKAALGLLV